MKKKERKFGHKKILILQGQKNKINRTKKDKKRKEENKKKEKEEKRGAGSGYQALYRPGPSGQV